MIFVRLALDENSLATGDLFRVIASINFVWKFLNGVRIAYFFSQ
jgi:hypothetical protein